MSDWRLLLINLPGRKASSRMRLWRGIRATGAATLRDGAYLLPADTAAALFKAPAEAIREAGGTAFEFAVRSENPDQARELRGLFDRTEAFSELERSRNALASAIDELPENQLRRRHSQLQREFAALAAIDFFPGDAQARCADGLQMLALDIERRFSSGEPRAASGAPRRLTRRDYRGRVWATRKHLWVDRVASAWLIGRFIDPRAQFVWLDSPADCPPDALGFDFDGATFTHLGDKVSFEVLLESFGLQRDPGLARLAGMVHFLDIGGPPCPEADGFAAILAGARSSQRGDDALLAHIGPVLDDLYSAFSTS